MDDEFRRTMEEILGKEKVIACYQCGICTGSCPSRRVIDHYSPRDMIMRMLLGMKEKLVKSDTVWLCTTCHTCDDRCPQKVNVSAALTYLKNLASEEGNVPARLVERVRCVLDTGRALQMSGRTDKLREKLELKKLEQSDTDGIRKIMEITALRGILEEKE